MAPLSLLQSVPLELKADLHSLSSISSQSPQSLDTLWVALWPAPISDYLAEPKAMAQGAHGCFHPSCSTLDRGAGESI